jgi:hypothetical protein
MAIDFNYVLERLSTRQIESGGYYGTDVTKLSKELGVTPRGLRTPSVTLQEFIEIEARIHSNPIEVKSHVLEDVKADRLSKGLQNLPSSTFYRVMRQTDLYLFLSEAKYSWFNVRGYLKRKTRILEGSKARVESHNVGLSLIAAELVISVAGLYHTLNGWSGPESPQIALQMQRDTLKSMA